MEKLRACVRGVNDFPKRVYYTCNPGGEGHAWVKRLFIDRRFKEGEEPEEHSFIQSLITDNTALMEADPQYIKQLEAAAAEAPGRVALRELGDIRGTVLRGLQDGTGP